MWYVIQNLHRLKAQFVGNQIDTVCNAKWGGGMGWWYGGGAVICDLLPQKPEQVAWGYFEIQGIKISDGKFNLKVKYEVLVFL